MPEKAITQGNELPLGYTTQGEKVVRDVAALEFGFECRRSTTGQRNAINQQLETEACAFVAEVLKGDWRIMSRHSFLLSRVTSDKTGPWWAPRRRVESAVALARFRGLATRERLRAMLDEGAIFVADLEAALAQLPLPTDCWNRIESVIHESYGIDSDLLAILRQPELWVLSAAERIAEAVQDGTLLSLYDEGKVPRNTMDALVARGFMTPTWEPLHPVVPAGVTEKISSSRPFDTAQLDGFRSQLEGLLTSSRQQ